MTTHTGSCVCGQLTYGFEGNPMGLTACHCLPCRKTSSTSATNNFTVSKDKLTFKGDTRQYTRKGDSGNDVVYTYCSICPTIILVEAKAIDGIWIVKAGTCDDEELLRNTTPTLEIYCKNRYPWVKPVVEASKQKEIA